MTFHLFAITISYFIIGFIATYLASRGKDDVVKKQRWIKIIVYFIIVHFILGTLLFAPRLFIYEALVIVIIGYTEIIKAGLGKQNMMAMIIALVIYGIASSAFLYLCYYVYLPDALIGLFILVFIFDGFSQITGQLLGKRKLLPKISPGKTIEGLMGGFVACFITACFFLYPHSDDRLKVILSTGIICLAALSGDLAASLYKRTLGIKDFNTIIPGHGGGLDRFDSLIAAGAVAALVNHFWILL